jgi:hypothetical protein
MHLIKIYLSILPVSLILDHNRSFYSLHDFSPDVFDAEEEK